MIQKLLTRKNIFIILGVVILAEVLWASWTLFRPTPPSPTQTAIAPVVKLKPTTVSLVSEKISLKKGEKITVSVNISSNSKTDGVDLVITYDPKLLSVETIGQTKQPVIAGTIYNDYPLNSLDQALGRITVSGITDVPGGVLADGLFGSLVFVGKNFGSAKISLDFSPGSTADSNVTETGTGKDVLEKVESLEINILP